MSEAEAVAVACPNCRAKLKVKAATGKSIRCPKCEESFVAEPAQDEKPRRKRKHSGEASPAESEPAPETKKKKRKKKRKTGLPLPLLIGGGVFLALLVVGGSIFVALKAASAIKLANKPMAAPESFEFYNAPEGFRVEHPVGWEKEDGGAVNHKWVKFTKGSASIKVRESLTGSLVGDIAGGAEEKEDEDLSAVAQVHAMKKEGFAEDYSDYAEETPEKFKAALGGGRRSAFTASSTFSKMRGYRATILGTLKQVDVVCQCPPSDWDALRPAFVRVIESVATASRQ